MTVGAAALDLQQRKKVKRAIEQHLTIAAKAAAAPPSEVSATTDAAVVALARALSLKAPASRGAQES